MKRFVLLLLLLCTGLAEARPVVLCVIGDSISEGFSPATRGWSSYLKGLHAAEDFGVRNVSESGIKVAGGQAIFDLELAGRDCTHVAFAIGTNDLPDGTSAATIYGGINTMCEAVEALVVNGRPAKCILVAIPPRATGASFSRARETVRTTLNGMLAARSGSIYVDASTALTGTASGTAWASSTAYSLDAVRVNGGKAYVVTTAGTSAESGGPTGTGSSITDGTVVWDYVPALGTEYGGGTDGLHPNNTGEAQLATTVEAAVVASPGGWYQ